MNLGHHEKFFELAGKEAEKSLTTRDNSFVRENLIAPGVVG